MRFYAVCVLMCNFDGETGNKAQKQPDRIVHTSENEENVKFELENAHHDVYTKINERE